MGRTIAVDFDGVIHSYTTPWTGPLTIPDAPVAGAFAWLRDAIDSGLSIVIFSTRCDAPENIVAMKKWFEIHAFEQRYLDKLVFANTKPTFGSLFIDDRGFCFMGAFPSIQFCKQFKPWNRK